jgi:hypothetical protein
MTAEERHRLTQLWPDDGRLWRALMLAPTIEIAEALLRSEAVPVDLLDSSWFLRFGGKRH